MPFEIDAEFWVAASFVVFIGVCLYAGAHRKLFQSLDARGARVSAELAEAKRLREEAEALLASFKQKAIEAEKEAAALIARAKAEAEALTAETAARMRDFIERRRKQADDKIALAETQATAQVRAAAADAATRAAAIVLGGRTASAEGDTFVADGIKDIKRLMH